MEQNFLTVNNFSQKKNSELYMTFSLASKVYAFPAEKIIEIVQLPVLTSLERLPEHILGLLNLRGQIISVIDLAKLLRIQKKAYGADSQILIVSSNNKTIGVIVDSVNDVISFDKNCLEPLPYKSKDKIVSGIYKNRDKLIAFLESEVIFDFIKEVHISDEEIENSSYLPSDMLPSDEASLEKLLKRTGKLQKEIRVVTDNLNYQDSYFVSFELNEEVFCINLKYVKEITKLKLVNLTPVPCVPEFITGIINLRGDFITIIDVKHFLKISKTVLSDKTKIIVVKVSNLQVGILVDEVYDIENIPNEKLNINSQSKYENHKYTSAEVKLRDNKIMSVLDLKKLVDDERLYIEDAI